MCGIVGAVSGRNVVPMLIDGLKRLEYRGYDSAGVAVVEANAAKSALRRVRCTGRCCRWRARSAACTASRV